MLQATDKQIVWFWWALESFNLSERQKFLRFVWGRSRLPPLHAAWEQEMEIVLKPPSIQMHASVDTAAASAEPTAATRGAEEAPAAAEEMEEAGSPRTIGTPSSGLVAIATYAPANPGEEQQQQQQPDAALQQLIDTMLPQSHTCFFQVRRHPFSSCICSHGCRRGCCCWLRTCCC